VELPVASFSNVKPFEELILFTLGEHGEFDSVSELAETVAADLSEEYTDSFRSKVTYTVDKLGPGGKGTSSARSAGSPTGRGSPASANCGCGLTRTRTDAERTSATTRAAKQTRATRRTRTSEGETGSGVAESGQGTDGGVRRLSRRGVLWKDGYIPPVSCATMRSNGVSVGSSSGVR